MPRIAPARRWTSCSGTAAAPRTGAKAASPSAGAISTSSARPSPSCPSGTPWADGPFSTWIRGRACASARTTARTEWRISHTSMKRMAGMWIVFLSVAALTATAGPAAALTWTWNYSGAGITAAGTFTTVDTPDPSGFYLITAIAGERNGAAIVALQPTGTPIPGNEPFAVDNLVKVDSPQLTTHGFGFAIAGGTFSNPFFASFLQPPIYLEFFSAPPSTSELP